MVDKKSIQESIDRSVMKNHISNIIMNNVKVTNADDVEDLMEKCKGPSNGYVDGVRYRKDYQRVTDGKAKVGEIEQKQLDAQAKVKKLYESKREVEEIRKLDDYPSDAIGYGLHGDDYATPNIYEPSDEDYGGSDGWDGGRERDTGAYWSELEGAMDTFEIHMKNAPGLVENTMLFTHDVPNPNLEEGDVFELDTYLGVNFKKKMVGAYEEMWSDVDIPYMRSTSNHYDDAYGDGYYNDSTPYEVTVLGSEGTPMLMTDPYQSSRTRVNIHEGVLNKGQKVRLVRVDHDKHTAIYQTVNG